MYCIASIMLKLSQLLSLKYQICVHFCNEFVIPLALEHLNRINHAFVMLKIKWDVNITKGKNDPVI